MPLQISIIGLFIILMFYSVAALSLAAFWKVLPVGRGRRVIIAALAFIALALPLADEMWISWHFNDLCKSAGVHIKRKVEVDGFYDDTMRSGYELIDRYGYKFMEHHFDNTAAVEHVEKVNGQWHKTILEQPSARYHFKFADPRQEMPVGYQLQKRETIIVDSTTGEVIGREISFNRYPGWVEGLWIRFFGSGQIICNRPLDDQEKKTPTGAPYYYALIPAAQK